MQGIAFAGKTDEVSQKLNEIKMSGKDCNYIRNKKIFSAAERIEEGNLARAGIQSDDHRRIALIPAYEPDIILLHLIKKLKDEGLDIIVVNDGSSCDKDVLFSKAASMAVVLNHPVNCGKGRALKTGLGYIRSLDIEDAVVVTVDADGQHSVNDVLRICDDAEKSAGIVLGSRRLKNKVPIRSKVGNILTRFVFSAATGLKVHDTQTGLRAFKTSLIPQLLAVTGERYEYEMNVLLEFAREQIPISETKIETIYIDNNSASHFNTIKDSLRIYREILKFSASSFAGFLIDYFLYGLLLFFTNNLQLANIGARIVSSSVNYSINRKYVFRSRKSIAGSAVQYFLLAAGIISANTIVLGYLVNNLGINSLTAKLLTEMIFFLVSWLVQHFLIFSGGKVRSD